MEYERKSYEIFFHAHLRDAEALSAGEESPFPAEERHGPGFCPGDPAVHRRPGRQPFYYAGAAAGSGRCRRPIPYSRAFFMAPRRISSPSQAVIPWAERSPAPFRRRIRGCPVPPAMPQQTSGFQPLGNTVPPLQNSGFGARAQGFVPPQAASAPHVQPASAPGRNGLCPPSACDPH